MKMHNNKETVLHQFSLINVLLIESKFLDDRRYTCDIEVRLAVISDDIGLPAHYRYRVRALLTLAS